MTEVVFGDSRLPERFWAKVRVEDARGCWAWAGSKITRGYGSFWFERRMWVAHRCAYTQLVGPIPDGLQLDHLCHGWDADDCIGGSTCPHRACVNPNHLEPVTASENQRRGVLGFGRRSHCRSGRHELTPEIIVVKSDGNLRCLECSREGWIARAPQKNQLRRERNAAKRRTEVLLQ